MNLEENIQKLEEKLKLINLKNIKIHIENFKDNGHSYIEFKLPDKTYEKQVSEMSSRFIRLVLKNLPEVLIEYINPHPCHNTDLRRIVINIDSSIKSPKEREELLERAAIDFYGILKRWVKYGNKG